MYHSFDRAPHGAQLPIKEDFDVKILTGLGICIVCCASSLSAGEIQGCAVFPPDNPWNLDISKAPVHPHSASYLSNILTGGNKFLHADFGSNLAYGIPYVVVSGTQAQVPINIVEYPDESDKGPFPIPLNAPFEGGDPKSGDRHVLVVDKDNCVLYEMYHAVQVGSGWNCGSSAKFDLKSNALRPDGWTSCDEAGLPILPGLVRYDEVTAGAIHHALRFTVHTTQKAYIHPATHLGTTVGPDFPPMGLRLRLKADFDTSKFTGQALVVLTALKTYGMFVADTGTDWYITGATDGRWNDDDLSQLKTVPGTAFEAVDTGPILGVDGTGGSGGGGGGGGGTGETGSALDTDGDGFPDELENALSSNPNSASSTPLNIPSGAPETLASPHLTVVLDFKHSSNDSLTLACALPVLPGTTVDGQDLVVDVGGIIQRVQLSSKGKGVNSAGSASVKIGKNGSAQLQAKFKGAFASNVSDEGLTQSNGGTPPVVGTIVLFAGKMYRLDITLNYAVKNGKGTGKN